MQVNCRTIAKQKNQYLKRTHCNANKLLKLSHVENCATNTVRFYYTRYKSHSKSE